MNLANLLSAKSKTRVRSVQPERQFNELAVKKKKKSTSKVKFGELL